MKSGFLNYFSAKDLTGNAGRNFWIFTQIELCSVPTNRLMVWVLSYHLLLSDFPKYPYFTVEFPVNWILLNTFQYCKASSHRHTAALDFIGFSIVKIAMNSNNFSVNMSFVFSSPWNCLKTVTELTAEKDICMSCLEIPWLYVFFRRCKINVDNNSWEHRDYFWKFSHIPMHNQQHQWFGKYKLEVWEHSHCFRLFWSFGTVFYK